MKLLRQRSFGRRIGGAGLVLCLGLGFGGAAAEGPSVEPSIEVGGRIQVDAAWYDEDLTALNDGTEFRRARLFATGDLATDWAYKAQFDFAGNDVTAKDLYIRYTGLEGADLTIGQFKQPFSLEDLTSSKYTTFMERSLPTAFSTGHRIGIGYARFQGAWGFQGSVYGQEADAGDGGDEGFGIGGRLIFTPLAGTDRLVHLGLAVASEGPEDGAASSVRFRARPESHVTDVRLVDTGGITNTDRVNKLGLEAAAVFGPFSVQGEYISVAVDRERGFEDFDFDGYYIYGSWILTGESRPYKKGSFSRLKPAADSGAWELGLRFSSLDLNDGTRLGGQQDDITLGLNYYLRPNVRFMANYVMVDTDATVGDDDPNIVQFRAAVDF